MFDQKTEIPPQKKNWKEEAKELIIFILTTLAIVIPIRYFIAQPFIVNGSSMDPTFYDGQYLIIDEISYTFNTPQRGDVVVFKFPLDTSRYFIKRIIGLPGETVEVKDGSVTIYNTQNPNGLKLNEPYVEFGKITNSKTVLNQEQYFVMGDNRSVSLDSRYWGPLDKKYITGRAFLRLLPVTKIGTFPGETSY